jgi:hypothetical protein
MRNFVKVTGFCFDKDCFFTLGKAYEVFTSYHCFEEGEQYVIDDIGKENYGIENCVITEPVI